MPDKTIQLLRDATQLNREEEIRKGNTLYLPDKGRLIVAGDLHGNRSNFKAIVRLADLENNPDTHLILQEIIHGGPEDENGGCLSFKLVFDAVALKIKYPSQVHFILGNHDTSVILGSDVLKNGKEMNRALFSALDSFYPQKSEIITLALKQFFFSQALAARTHTGIFIAHSLPADRFVDEFDPELLDRDLQINDIIRPNSAYLLTWGRRHSQQTLDRFAQMFNARLFILGHQSQPEGYAKGGDNLLIIGSDQANGVVAELDLAIEYNIEQLLGCVRKLAYV